MAWIELSGSSRGEDHETLNPSNERIGCRYRMTQTRSVAHVTKVGGRFSVHFTGVNRQFDRINDY